AISVGPADVGCPIEVPIGGLHHPGLRVSAVADIEAVQRGQCAPWSDLEDRALVVSPAPGGCPVEVPIGGLHQPGVRASAVRAASLSTKAVQRGQRAPWADFEDRATGVAAAVVAGSAVVGCPIEVSVAGLHQPGARPIAVAAVEAVQRGQRAPWGDFEDRATATGTVAAGCGTVFK